MGTEQASSGSRVVPGNALVIERVNGDWPKWASLFMAQLADKPKLYGEFVLDDLYDEAKSRRRSRLIDVCSFCGDIDPWVNSHVASAVKGRYSNGSPMFTPACQCGEVFEDGPTTESFESAKSLASRLAHPFGKKIYCVNPWHVENPLPVSPAV